VKNKVIRPFYLVVLCIWSQITLSVPVIDYDIVYVRYPAENGNSPYVTIPQGEQPYPLQMGADLMLLKADGTEQVLVDCEGCTVMEPMMSFDGKTVYYSLNAWKDGLLFSWIYKMHLQGPRAFAPIRLTFNDGFDSKLYAANTSKEHDQMSRFGIRDMGPVPLEDGRILFTSNRSGLTALDMIGHNPEEVGSVQQLYTIDDHDGIRNDKYLSNLVRLEAGTLHLAQHPIQLLDGRILFTTWQDVADKYNYAMSSLFTVHPDGTNLKQFTEPHDRNKFLDHFITQLSDTQVVSAYYYPSFDYGYGVLWRAPLQSDGPDFHKKFGPKPKHKMYPELQRYFERKGSTIITPHTTPADVPAPGRSGKYSMPSATKNNGLLVAYSKGYVNWFDAVCGSRNQCEALRSGIYLIEHANEKIITNPNQLIKVKDDPKYNEIWPRAVLPYKSIYGLDKPESLPITQSEQRDSRLAIGQVASIVGSSSMYNRDKNNTGDSFQDYSDSREITGGNWTIQGATAGVFSNKDIYGVRIVGTPPKPFTKPIDKFIDPNKWNKARKYITRNYDRIVERYGAFHSERWEILGEFPLNYKDVLDEQGNPDSSWAAKIPAETPFLIQAIDKNGMTLISELTWRALKPGEVRTDCGGCHAHTVPKLDYDTTFSSLRVPIQGIEGTTKDSPGLALGLWDLTTGKIPVLSQNGVEYLNQNVLGVEYNRDIKPILKNQCAECHTKNGSGSSLVLDGSDGRSAWDNLSNQKRPDGANFIVPQRSKYIRVPQARQSLLAWVAYGERLDGRSNNSRKDDVDYPDKHPTLFLSDKEKRTISRWLDLGGPVDFPETDGMGYTEDNQLPVLNLLVESWDSEWGKLGYKITVGAFDLHSGINWNNLEVRVEKMTDSIKQGENTGWVDNLLGESNEDAKLEPEVIDYQNGVMQYYYKTKNDSALMIKAQVSDLVGNKNEASKYISTE
jgi:hypothetical protein